MLLEMGIHKFFSSYETFPLSFKGCCQYLIASVLYHLKTLRSWWGDGHPLFASQMFTMFTAAQLKELSEEVVTKTFRDDEANMTSTGVPDSVHKSLEMKELKDMVKQTFQAMGQCQAALTKQMEALPGAIEKLIGKDSRFSGAARLEIDGLMASISDLKKSVDVNFASLANKTMLPAEPSESTAALSATIAENSPQYIPFHYGGELHAVPENFVFPTCSAATMWVRWHFGMIHDGQKIGPFKFLRTRYRKDIHFKQRPNLNKAGIVMDAVEKIAAALGLLNANVGINIANHKDIWFAAFPVYLKFLYGEDRVQSEAFRGDELYYSTLSNRHTELDEGQSRFDKSMAEWLVARQNDAAATQGEES
jgi:hypothetical protein